MSDDSSRISLTGNPFVDTGLGVIGIRSKLDDINQLTLGHLKSVYGDGSQLADWNLQFKSFTQLFTVNNPLTHPGLKRVGLNVPIYRNIMGAILTEAGKPGLGPRCWACGAQSDFDFAKTYKKAFEDAGRVPPKEENRVSRTFFPLAGSLGSDAQSLPSASDAPYLCPKCLFAVQYLPMGIVLIKGYNSRDEIKSFPAVFQSTSNDFWYELLGTVVREVMRRAHAGEYESLGKKEGGLVVTGILLELFRRLQEKQKIESVPRGTDLYVWRFNNFGDSADCRIDTIPNAALEFLSKAVGEGLRKEVETLVAAEGKNLRYSLYQSILDRRDYSNLYPRGNKNGASSKLFALYQTYICSHSASSLLQAHKLAREAATVVSEKELERIQQPRVLNKETVRNRFKASMVRMTERGAFSLKDYLDLFPLEGGHGISVGWHGWELIRFYLHHTNEDFPKLEEKDEAPTKEAPQLRYYAGYIYNHYLSERGMDRFRKEVLSQMGRKIGDSWLRSQFVQLAESAESFTYGDWLSLCTLDYGKSFVSELLFQMRLLWTQWVYENRVRADTPTLQNGESIDGLPEHMRTLIEAVFTEYVDTRGLQRFHREVLLRLRRKEIGLVWLKRKMMKQIPEGMNPIPEGEWKEFLVDEEGRNIQTDRLFQLHLALANMYEKKKKHKEMLT